MNLEDKLKKCIELLQTPSTYSTKVLAELLQLDIIHNKGRITESLEFDIEVIHSYTLKE